MRGDARHFFSNGAGVPRFALPALLCYLVDAALGAPGDDVSVILCVCVCVRRERRSREREPVVGVAGGGPGECEQRGDR